MIALIPLRAVFFTASNTIAGACDAGLAAQTIALDTPVGEMTKTICDGILASVPAVQTFLNEQLGTTITVSPTLTLAGIVCSPSLDVDQARHRTPSTSTTMLFGLIVHLPAAMSAAPSAGTRCSCSQGRLGGRIPSGARRTSFVAPAAVVAVR